MCWLIAGPANHLVADKREWSEWAERKIDDVGNLREISEIGNQLVAKIVALGDARKVVEGMLIIQEL